MEMKRWIRQLIVLTGILALGVQIGLLKVHAADNNQSQIGFTVEPVIPDNQIDKDATYFHLAVEPDKEQEISVKVKSLIKDPVTVDLGVTNAVTSTSGVIDYGQEKPVLDESLKVPLTTMVSIPKNEEHVTVQNFEEKIVKIKIHPPKEEFSGIKLGALTFMKAEDKNAKKRAGISNRYGYKIGLILSEDRTTYNEGADLKLKTIKPGLENGMKMINITFQNPEPKILSKLKIEAKMTKKGSKEVLKEQELTDRSLAPNSSYIFGIPWGMESIKPGDYTMHIIAQSGDRKWKWDEDFTIEAAEANKVNKKAVNKFTITKKMLILIIIVLLLNAILLVLRLTNSRWQKPPKQVNVVKKKKKRKKQDE
ncbi:DUF916 and DUF3324 domain-containing protein [Vagococcus bubulae]|uniref:Uncharacterized protein n=1 Tax=Vagococcus bubulae TaxID=1977868 RepID=A0A429ZN55_9ENTE|nr:DUF916 and DUF3324 domain-containing protein [Vagococcus bubulae]RST95108.1 hypothetical protein CBF36_04355 [Vagococcus bubulae]